jgi:hypothetical protein
MSHYMILCINCNDHFKVSVSNNLVRGPIPASLGK